MNSILPQQTRIYRNHMLDSPRWRLVKPREGDTVVVTPYKSGTTWMLNIVRELFALKEELPPFREQWVDCRFRQTEEEFAAQVEALTHRRYFKSHLALDGLPFYPNVKYIVVGRDVRDVFMSFWNHHNMMHQAGGITRVNEVPDRVGDPMPAPPDDIHTSWRQWIGRGWFPWEQEGYPFWGNMHNVQSWWEYRHLPNIMFVHFNELKHDLDEQIRRIGRFLDIEVTDNDLPGIRTAVNIDVMQARVAQTDAVFAERFFRHRGTNGRWRDVLTEEELELYERKAAAVLSPSCREWLEDWDRNRQASR